MPASSTRWCVSTCRSPDPRNVRSNPPYRATCSSMWSRNARPVATLTLPFPSRSTVARNLVSLLLRVTSPFLLKAHLHRVRVRVQSLQPCQPNSRFTQLLHVAAIKAQHARLLHERAHAERRRKARRARSRERVVWPRRVITERNCGIGTHEDRTGVLDLLRAHGRVFGDEEEVLGRELVGDLHRLVEATHHYQAARHGTNDLRPLQAQQQVVKLLLD